MTRHYLLPGDQVAYIPNHADSLLHNDLEFGFVTKVAEDGESAFVRYWSKYERGLRTKSCSECTPTANLVPLMSRPQSEVRDAILAFTRKDEGDCTPNA